MKKRYFSKIVHINDKFNVVIGKGSESGLKIGAKFLIVRLGDSILDPDTNEIIEQLEIVKGKAHVTHLQDKLATLSSYEYDTTEETKEIIKTKNINNQLMRHSAFAGLLKNSNGLPEETITETIKPGSKILRGLGLVQIGDCVIEI
jgi:hypothetical protein